MCKISCTRFQTNRLKMKVIRTDIILMSAICLLIVKFANTKEFSANAFVESNAGKTKLRTTSNDRQAIQLPISFIKPYQLCVKHF
jgi:hypothetical protein